MVKLQLGAFDQILDGWINTDITPHLTIARVPGLARALHLLGRLPTARLQQHDAGIFRRLRRLDVTRRFPFANDAVDAIYISHMISNVSRAGAQHCLQECHRVLKPGGILRVSTLDLDATIAAYNPTQPDVTVDLLFDLDTSRRAKNRHWWHYNEISLVAKLRDAGFRDCVRRAFREGLCPDVERVDTRPESLFMEAYK